MMQRFDFILVSAMFAFLSFSPTFATPWKKSLDNFCSHLPKTFSSLPGNFSIEVLLRSETLEETTPGNRSFVRIYTEFSSYMFTTSDLPEIVAQPNKGATVFQLKNNRLIPVGGSGPAVNVAGTNFVFGNQGADLNELDFTAIEDCDEEGTVYQSLKTDGCEFVCLVLSFVVEHQPG